MTYEPLTNLITALEKGTSLHISVVFLNHYGNAMTRRPISQSIHSTPVCNAAKQNPDGFASCRRCRDIVLRKCTNHKKPFGGLCVKGVYEYCHPVIRNHCVAAVIFVGNILTNDPKQHHRLQSTISPALLSTMESGFTSEEIIRTAKLVESYILLLLDQYGDTAENVPDSLIENIKAYLEENLLLDISMGQLAAFFGYNEKYLGRMFKKKTNQSIAQYCNQRRITIAMKALLSTQCSISEIAAQCGFNNVTYFNRLFKLQTGQTPQCFRESNI